MSTIYTATDLFTATEAERTDFFGELQKDANGVEKWGDGDVGALLNKMLLVMQAQAEALVGVRKEALAARHFAEGSLEHIQFLVGENESLRAALAMIGEQTVSAGGSTFYGD